jgi:hypothetical protein
MLRKQNSNSATTSAATHLLAVKGIVTAIAALAVIGGGLGTYLVGLSHLNGELVQANSDATNYKADLGLAAFGAVIGKALQPLAAGQCALIPILIAFQ